MPDIGETIQTIKQGVKNATISGAISNIEGWERTLQDVDGAETVVQDLGDLKTELQADTLDGEAIRGLIMKLGQGTMDVAKSAGGSKASQIQQLGQALTQAAQNDGAPGG